MTPGVRRAWLWTAATGGAALAVVLLWRFGVLEQAWQGIVDGGTFVAERYGIDLRAAIGGFALAEAVYVGSIVVMLHEAGTRHVQWRDIRHFKLRDLRLGSPRMMFWLTVNRMSWIVYWTMIIVVTWSRVPWWATAAAFADNVSTVFWWVVAVAGLKLPWWNRGKAASDADARRRDSGIQK
jgi:hypothetical protein